MTANTVNVNIEPSQATILPNERFMLEMVDVVARLNFDWHIDSRRQILQTEVLKDFIFISMVDQETYESAMEMFPTGKYFSTYRFFYEMFSKSARSDKRNRYQVFMHLAENTFDLFMFEKQKLIFANTFKHNDVPKDMLFYALHAFNHRKIDTGGLTLKLIDSHGNSNEYKALLEPYFLALEELEGRDNPLNLRIDIQPGIFVINNSIL